MFYTQNKYRVFNLNEFLESDFNDVLEANQKGFLRRGEEQRVQRYIKDRQEKREKAEREWKEFKERQQQYQQQERRKK